MSTSRPYRSPLRDEQSRRTRRLILDALIELVSAEGATDLSIRDLAHRAGVSQRTVYRHFPDRQALLDGLGEHVGEIAEWSIADDRVSTLEDLAEQIPDTFATYDRYETETRALVLLNLDPARVSRLTRGNQDMLRRVVATELAHLDDDEQAGAVAVLHLLASSRTWLRFRDQDGLAPGEPGRVARRAALAVIADLRRDAPVH